MTARLEGRDLGSAMGDVRQAVAGLHLPPGVRVDYGGLYAEQQKSFRDLTTVFVAALLLIGAAADHPLRAARLDARGDRHRRCSPPPRF